MGWFSTWGGVALRQARQALEIETLGLNFFNDSLHYAVGGSTNCFDVPQEDVYDPSGTDVIFTNYLPGVTPVCKMDPSNTNSAPYNVLYSFSYPSSLTNGYGPFLTLIFVIALAIYFATSSDSGSLIVDNLSANGRGDHDVDCSGWSGRSECCTSRD